MVRIMVLLNNIILENIYLGLPKVRQVIRLCYKPLHNLSLRKIKLCILDFRLLIKWLSGQRPSSCALILGIFNAYMWKSIKSHYQNNQKFLLLIVNKAKLFKVPSFLQLQHRKLSIEQKF